MPSIPGCRIPGLPRVSATSDYDSGMAGSAVCPSDNIQWLEPTARQPQDARGSPLLVRCDARGQEISHHRFNTRLLSQPVSWTFLTSTSAFLLIYSYIIVKCVYSFLLLETRATERHLPYKSPANRTCLHPDASKCERSFLLTDINTCIAICRHAAAVNDMFTIDSL